MLSAESVVLSKVTLRLSLNEVPELEVQSMNTCSWGRTVIFLHDVVAHSNVVGSSYVDLQSIIIIRHIVCSVVCAIVNLIDRDTWRAVIKYQAQIIQI